MAQQSFFLARPVASSNVNNLGVKVVLSQKIRKGSLNYARATRRQTTHMHPQIKIVIQTHFNDHVFLVPSVDAVMYCRVF